MKILFTDIDGVLCTQEEIFHDPAKKKSGEIKVEDYMREVNGTWLHIFRPVAVAALNHITDTTGAKLVISSTWKNKGIDRLKIHFKDQGVTGEIVGKTPNVYNEEKKCKIRGEEIQAWLDENPAPESFVILDDMDEMEPLKNYLVQTDHTKGLQDEQVDKAIKMLGE